MRRVLRPRPFLLIRGLVIILSEPTGVLPPAASTVHILLAQRRVESSKVRPDRGAIVDHWEVVAREPGGNCVFDVDVDAAGHRFTRSLIVSLIIIGLGQLDVARSVRGVPVAFLSNFLIVHIALLGTRPIVR